LIPSVVSAKIRWLAVLAGCSSAIFAALAFGAPFLILGAIVQPWARTTGRWLIWLGAFLLSLMVVPFGTGIVLGQARHLGRDNWSFSIFPLFVLSTALIYCCDIALVTDAFKSKRQQWVRGSLDWLVWVVAIAPSAWCIWQNASTVRAYRLNGGLRLDLILTSVRLDALILFFDVALVVHAIRCRPRASD
jgi:hypothetical protein